MKKISLIISIICISLAINAQEKFPLDQDLPMNPKVKMGQLSNGMKYYILENHEPKNRAELRLVVNAGSVLETEEELGLAHFMEHMQFNGTTNYPKNKLVDFLQKSGLKFGADLNAYTSFDETVYMLPVPSDSLEKFEKYFEVLSEWANKATLDHEEIDKERGVVLEESRLRKGAQDRIQKELIPLILKDSKYANRLPIGTDENLENFKYETLENFYKKWYRPDLQAVIAVGDFDQNQVEAFIKKHFGDIPARKDKLVRPKISIPLNGGTDAKVITDPEQPYTMVQLFYKQEGKDEITGKDKIENIRYSLFNTMMSARLQELLQSEDPPFLFGGTNYGGFLGGLNSLTVVAVAKDNKIEKALKAVLTENQRAKQFGFTETELERAKTQYMTGREKQFNERDKTNSGAFTGQLVQSFLKGVNMTDISFDLDFAKAYLNDISLEEINQLVKKVITNDNRAVVLLAPEKDKETLPSETKLIEWVNEQNEDISAYVDEVIDQPLLAKMPIAGKVISSKTRENLGVTELTLSNNVKVILKPTEFKNDEIKILASSKGGTNTYSDEDYQNASASNLISSVSGIGDFSATQLKKYLNGKISSVRSYVGKTSEGISASSSVKDLETTLQQINLKFTGNRIDTTVLKGTLANQRSFLKNLEETPTPEGVYRDTLSAVLSSYSIRAKRPKPEDIDAIDINKSFEILNNRFADADDFVFTVVGNFTVNEITPLLEKYIGSLPSLPTSENYVDINDNPLKGNINKVVKKGTEDKASVTLTYSGECDIADEDQIEALGDILNLKLIEKLREEESGVYSPRVRASAGEFPSQRFSFTVSFGCSPANVDKLIGIVKDQIEQLKSNGAEASDIEKFKAEEKLDIQEALKTNSFWLSKLNSAYLNQKDPEKILDLEKNLENVTVNSTKTTANKYLTGKNIIQAVLLPE